MNPWTKHKQTKFLKLQGVSMINPQQDVYPSVTNWGGTLRLLIVWPKVDAYPTFIHILFDDDDILLQEILNGASNQC